MANKDFNLTLKMRAEFAQAQAALKAAQANVAKIGGELDRVNRLGATTRNVMNGVGVAVASIAAIGIATTTRYIKNTIDLQNEQAMLAARIKSTGGIAGQTMESLGRMADEMRRTTAVTGDQISKAQDLLLTFTNVRGAIYDDALPALLDMAVAMRQDTGTAAIQLGKALNDPVKGVAALGKAGIQFSADQKAMIEALVKTGNVAEAQRIILGELETQFGGSAVAARDTLGGALINLRETFDELLEGRGDGNGVRGARDAIDQLAATMGAPETKAAFDSMVSGFATTADWAAKAAGAVGGLIGKYQEWLESKGFAPTDGDSSREDLQARRARLKTAEARASGGMGMGRLVFGDDTAKQLRAQIAAVDRQLATYGVKIIRPGDKTPEALLRPLAAGGTQPDPEAIAAARAAAAAAKAAADAKKAGKGKKETDPDDAGRKRIVSLQEEIALLGTLAAGETKVSDAAKLRYDITFGELAKISPALKQQLLDLQDVADAKNAALILAEEEREALKKTKEAYQDLREELRTPLEIALDRAIEQVDRLNAAFKENLLNKQEYEAAAGRIAAGAFDKAPKYGGLSPEIGGPFSELAKINEAREELAKWHEEKLEMLTQLRVRESELNAQWDAQELELTAQHQAALRQLDSAQTQVMLAGASAMFGNLADIAKTFGGEQSKTYKALFALSKAFAIAQSAIALAQNVAEASKIGFPQNIPMIAGAFAQGASIVAMLSGAQFSGGGGYAEGGFTGPGGKYEPAGIVHKGEGVLSQKEIAGLGGKQGFFDLRRAIEDGTMRELLYGWAGYADGGLVMPGPTRMAEPNWASFPQGSLTVPRPQVNQRNYLVLDSEEIGRSVAETAGFETSVLKVLANNPRALAGNF